MELKHIPVMPDECIDGLNIRSGGVIVDGTTGGGGHSRLIAAKLAGSGRLICIDKDSYAINRAKEALSGYDCCEFAHGNFSDFNSILDKLSIDKVDAVLLDLGASSFHFDDVSRGFSYMFDAPLDMRMDVRQEFSAYDVINGYGERELNDIFFKYGEERWAKRIAEFIVKERAIKPITTTQGLVSVIKAAIPKAARAEGSHPAKRVFQAVRIEVNSEIEILDGAIKNIAGRLNSGGRICILTFHSGEDRAVKSCFHELESPCTCPREFPVCVCGKKPSLRVITRKPLLPSGAELEINHRARSAKLRIAEKI